MASKKQTLTEDFKAAAEGVVSEGKLEVVECEVVSVVGAVTKADKDHKTDMIDNTISVLSDKIADRFSVLQAEVGSITLEIDKLMQEARTHYQKTWGFIPEMNSDNRIFKAIGYKLITKTDYASGYVNNLLSRFKKCWNQDRSFSLKDPISEGVKTGARAGEASSKGSGSQAGEKPLSEAKNALTIDVAEPIKKQAGALKRVFANSVLKKDNKISETDVEHVLDALIKQIDLAGNASHLTHVKAAIVFCIDAIHMGEAGEEGIDEAEPEEALF